MPGGWVNPPGMKTLASPSLKTCVNEIVEGRHLLRHPFYVAWTAGELTLDQLRHYAGQYMHQVLAEPTYLSAVHSNTPDIRARQAILQNLVEEELGPRNHPALWKQFAQSLGLTETELASARALPQTRALIETFTDLCRNRPYYVGLAALYAFESQVPAIAAAKIDGLRRYYGFTDPADYEFFTVHESADVVHSGVEMDLIERAADTEEKRAAVLDATAKGCEALWAFLDGAYAA